MIGVFQREQAHLHEAHAVKVLPDVVDDLASRDEDVSNIVVHDQIEVSLSISDFLVGQTSIGRLGQHVQTRGEEGDLRGRDRQFTLLGSRRCTGNTDNITSSEESVDLMELLFVLGIPG